ncbi:hypothetical protein OBK20_04865 [Empedobacter falsenii]
MKFKLLLLVLFFNINYTFSQNLIELNMYQMSYFKKDFIIEVGNDNTIKKKKKDIDKYFIDYYISVQSIEDINNNDRVSLLVKHYKYDKFIEYLENIKSKYVEWKNIAIVNNIENINKIIDVKAPIIDAVFYYSDWHIDKLVHLETKFTKFDDKFSILINSDELTSWSNEFIKNKGFALVFSSEEEIEDFINKLNNEKAIELIKSKEAKEDLFK